MIMRIVCSTLLITALLYTACSGEQDCVSLSADTVGTLEPVTSMMIGSSGNGTGCWKLETSEADHVIRLVLTSFSDENNSLLVSIYDGTNDTSPRLVSWSGATTEYVEVLSTGPMVSVYWTAAVANIKQSFQLLYSSMPDLSKTGCTLLSTTPTKQNVRSSADLDDDSVTCWILNTNNSLERNKIRLESSSLGFYGIPCSEGDLEYFKFLDGPSRSSPIIQWNCGGVSRQTTYSSGQYMYVELVLSSAVNTVASPFINFQYETMPVADDVQPSHGCTSYEYYEGQTMDVMSPFYPAIHPTAYHICFWIYSEDDVPLRVEVTDIQFSEIDRTCKDEYLDLYDGVKMEEYFEKKICSTADMGWSYKTSSESQYTATIFYNSTDRGSGFHMRVTDASSSGVNVVGITIGVLAAVVIVVAIGVGVKCYLDKNKKNYDNMS